MIEGVLHAARYPGVCVPVIDVWQKARGVGGWLTVTLVAPI